MRTQKLWHAVRAVTCMTWALSRLSGFAPDGAERWLNAAGSMPPELGADVLIRAAGAKDNIVADVDRILLLVRAFELASRAQEPHGKVSRVKTLRESRVGYVALSAGLGVNRLALQCRVVRAVLSYDPSAARQLLEKVDMPAVPPASCGEPVIADVSEYYETARAVLAHPVAEERRARFLARLLEHIHSPVQLAPVARLLAQSEVSGPDFKRLLENYALALRGMRGGDPAFRYAVLSQRLAVEVEAVARKCGADSDLAGTLLLAFREFLTAHLSGPACHGSFLPEARREIQRAVVEPYNNRLRIAGVLARDGLPPLEMDELWPSDADNTRPEVRGFWQYGDAETLRAQLAEGDADGGGPVERHIAPDEIAYQVIAWQQPAEMAEEDFFHQKLLLYRRVARTVSRGAKRLEAVSGLVAFLDRSPMQGRAPAEWLWHVIALMRDHVLREEVLPLMGEASGPALQSYAELERRLPLSIASTGTY